ncbi:hypothetical protein [Leucobacter sp.]
MKKERRASGVKFSKPAKVPTPLEQRREFRETVQRPLGMRLGGQAVPRSEKQIKKVREAWGIDGGDAA